MGGKPWRRANAKMCLRLTWVEHVLAQGSETIRLGMVWTRMTRSPSRWQTATSAAHVRNLLKKEEQQQPKKKPKIQGKKQAEKSRVKKLRVETAKAMNQVVKQQLQRAALQPRLRPTVAFPQKRGAQTKFQEKDLVESQ